MAVLSLTWSPSGIRLSPATTNSSEQQLSSSEHTGISAEVSAGHGPRSTTALVTRCVPLNSKTLPNCLPKRVHKFKLSLTVKQIFTDLIGKKWILIVALIMEERDSSREF